jgi:hypothetical protein
MMLQNSNTQSDKFVPTWRAVELSDANGLDLNLSSIWKTNLTAAWFIRAQSSFRIGREPSELSECFRGEESDYIIDAQEIVFPFVFVFFFCID